VRGFSGVGPSLTFHAEDLMFETSLIQWGFFCMPYSSVITGCHLCPNFVYVKNAKLQLWLVVCGNIITVITFLWKQI
jgi:hypothetical protein